MQINKRDLIKLFRRDISEHLVHLTRKNYDLSAKKVLLKIMYNGKLIGGNGFIKSKDRCICFSEAPITEIAMLLKANEATFNSNSRPRYEPYGVVVPKEWFYQKGGCPVIYQSGSDYHYLSREIRYKHVRFELNNNIDFTWEREWRLKADELILDPKQVTFIVNKSEDIHDLQYGHFSNMKYAVAVLGDDAHQYIEQFPWKIISLDILQN